jgi:TonB family protein
VPRTELRAVCGETPLSPNTTERRTVILHAVAELAYQAPDTARLYASYLLDEFAREFRYPTPFELTMWGSRDSVALVEAIPMLATEAMVVIRPDGRLRSLALTQTSLSPAIDAAFESALRKAAQTATLPVPSALRIRNDITLYFALTLEPALDLMSPSASPKPSLTPPLTPPRRTVELALLRLEVPSARFSRVVLPDQKRSKPVRFPPELLAAAKDGDVTIQFVVGRDGSVIPGTVRLIGATERGFANLVVRTLKDLRFFPAEIDGCPVPVLVTQSFSFRIDRL